MSGCIAGNCWSDPLNLLVACVVPSRAQVQNLLELGDEEVDQAIAQAQQLSEPYLQALLAFSREQRTGSEEVPIHGF